MKELSIEDLRNLEVGSKVTRIKNTGKFEKDKVLRFVGTAPDDKNRLIFCFGSHIETLCLHSDTVSGRWFLGYDPEMVGNILIGMLEEEIESIKEIYFK